MIINYAHCSCEKMMNASKHDENIKEKCKQFTHLYFKGSMNKIIKDYRKIINYICISPIS